MPPLLAHALFWTCVAACAAGTAAVAIDTVRRSAPARDVLWALLPAAGLALLLGATWAALPR